MIKSFKYRLYPNKTQANFISNQLFEASKLYNTALEHRIWAYKTNGKSINYYDQAAELKVLRAEGLCGLINFSCCQDVLRRIDKTYKAFFNRIKLGEKAGFPRFKAARRYNSITFPTYGDGCKLKNQKIYLQGIGDINIRLHRPVDGKIKTVTILRRNNKFYVIFSCETTSSPFPETGNKIGIDMGIESFAITTDGEFIQNNRYYASHQRRLRVLQRSVSRKKKGSNNRKKTIALLSKEHENISNQRRDFLHKISTRLIKENDTICIEDLNIKGLSGGMLAKSVHDVSWGIFFDMLAYKAENADREVIRVNPNGTSQRCNNCGTVVKKKLKDRWHDCVCGESVHRDINSAKEILRLGISLCKPTYPVRESVLQEAV